MAEAFWGKKTLCKGPVFRREGEVGVVCHGHTGKAQGQGGLDIGLPAGECVGGHCQALTLRGEVGLVPGRVGDEADLPAGGAADAHGVAVQSEIADDGAGAGVEGPIEEGMKDGGLALFPGLAPDPAAEEVARRGEDPAGNLLQFESYVPLRRRSIN